MDNILKAIFAKAGAATNLYADVGGRIYLDEAPEGAAFPYVVISIVSSSPDYNFTDCLEDTAIQFSLYSDSSSIAELATIYGHLKALFDESVLSITGSTCLHCRRKNFITMPIETTTPSGTTLLRHWAVEYELLTET